MVNIKEYQGMCKKTAKVIEDKNKEIVLWGLGIAGEAGDIASCIKKQVFHENANMKDGIRENIGDSMWYISMICNFYGWNLDEILNENLDKLNKRYASGGFTLNEAQRNGTMKKWSGEDSDVKIIGDANGKEDWKQ